jgi:hypothetical protein
MFAHGNPFQPSPMLWQGKEPILDWSPFEVFHLGKLCLTRKHYYILERLALDKHSSLFKKFDNYGRKNLQHCPLV